jgi:hypothetical protein
VKLGKQYIRTGLASIILFWGSVISHTLAGGTFVNFKHCCMQSVLIFSFLIFIRTDQLRGPKLASVVLLTQSASHITIGGMRENTLRMVVSHTTAGLISYGFLVFLESSLFSEAKLIIHFFLKDFNFKLSRYRLINFMAASWISKTCSQFYLFSFRYRGPPVYMKNRILAS